MRSEEYHLHVVYTRPHVMGEATPNHFQYRKLIVRKPIYSAAQEGKHPYPEWMQSIVNHHATTNEMKDAGHEVADIVGSFPNQTETGEMKSKVFIDNTLRRNESIRQVHFPKEENELLNKVKNSLGEDMQALGTSPLEMSVDVAPIPSSQVTKRARKSLKNK